MGHGEEVYSFLTLWSCRPQTLESQLAQEKIEVDHLSGLLGQAKEKSDRDKEALKKATR